MPDHSKIREILDRLMTAFVLMMPLSFVAFITMVFITLTAALVKLFMWLL